MLTKINKNVLNFMTIFEFNKKCIPISINMPSIGIVFCEIDFQLLETKLFSKTIDCNQNVGQLR